jgi:hypothetical protein
MESVITEDDDNEEPQLKKVKTTSFTDISESSEESDSPGTVAMPGMFAPIVCS